MSETTPNEVDIETRLADFQRAFDERGEEVFEELGTKDPELFALVTDAGAELLTDSTEEIKPKRESIRIHLKPGESEDRALARLSCTPEALAAISISEVWQAQGQPIGVNELIEELEVQTDAMRNGEAKQASILSAQSYTLDALFNQLLILALAHVQANRLSTGSEILRLAMRAQSQCRTTLDSLTTIQRPAIKQTNIAHGHQQVNNFPEKENPPNEVLEKTDGERLVTGTPPEAVRANSDLETVDE